MKILDIFDRSGSDHSLKPLDQSELTALEAILFEKSERGHGAEIRCYRSRADTDRGGGYRRDHLRTLDQRVEVADREVRIIGSKSNLLHTLAVAPGTRQPGLQFAVLFRNGVP